MLLINYDKYVTMYGSSLKNYMTLLQWSTTNFHICMLYCKKLPYIYTVEELPSLLWNHNEITQQEGDTARVFPKQFGQMLCWDNNITTGKGANQPLSSQWQISQPDTNRILVIIF